MSTTVDEIKDGQNVPGIAKIDHVTEYSEKGYIGHPVASPKFNDRTTGKRPIPEGWTKRTTPMTPEEITAAFKGKDNLNYGLLTGERSGIMVIDVDDELFISDLLQNIDTSNFVMVNRDGADRGHIYFQYDPDIRACKRHTIGIEILTDDKNNVIVPPSMHYTGTQYKWNIGHIPSLGEIPDMPKLLKDRIKKLFATDDEVKTIKNKIRPCFKKFLNTPEMLHGADGRRFMIALAADMVANGASDEAVHMVARLVYRGDYDYSRTAQELGNIDPGKTWKCETLRTEFNDFCICGICNYHKGDANKAINPDVDNSLTATQGDVSLRVVYEPVWTLSYISFDGVEVPQAVKSKDGYCVNVDLRTKTLVEILVMLSNGKLDKDRAKEIIKKLGFDIARQEHARPEAQAEYTAPIPYFDGNTFVAKRLADELMEEYVFMTPTNVTAIIAKLHVYVYSAEGYYKQGGEAVIMDEAQKRLADNATTLRLNEVVRHIRIATMCDDDPFNHSMDTINVKNGLLDWRTGKLRPHTSTHLSTIQLNAEWDKDAACVKVDEFLEKAVNGEDRLVLVEFIGYLLIPDISEQRVVFLHNPEGGSGKSTMLDLITNLLGSQNVAQEGLHELENDPFSIANLRGKLANIFPDLNPKAIYSNDVLKRVATEKELRGVEKFMTAGKFRNITRIMFAANKLPDVPDDMAYFDRVMLLRFHHRFRGTDEEIKDYAGILSTSAELNGLLKKAVEGLRRLKNNGGFSYTSSSTETAKRFEIHGDNVKAFMKYMIIEAVSDVCTLNTYAAYAEWCNEYDVAPILPKTFASKMTKAGFCKYRQTSGDRLYFWENMEVRDTTQEKSGKNAESVQCSKSDGQRLDDIRKVDGSLLSTNPSNLWAKKTIVDMSKCINGSGDKKESHIMYNGKNHPNIGRIESKAQSANTVEHVQSSKMDRTCLDGTNGVVKYDWNPENHEVDKIVVGASKKLRAQTKNITNILRMYGQQNNNDPMPFAELSKQAQAIHGIEVIELNEVIVDLASRGDLIKPVKGHVKYIGI